MTQDTVAEAVSIVRKMKRIKKNTRMFAEVLDTLGLTLEDVAKQCGVTTRTVVKWRSGKRPDKVKHYIALQQLLAGVDISVLFDEDE